MEQIQPKETKVRGLTLRGTLELTESGHVPPQYFGKDHWSLLGYIGSRQKSHPANGKKDVAALDKQHLRCNPHRHPLHAINEIRGGGGWRDRYGTRLRGYWRKDKPGETNEEWRIQEHDDWDCLNDLEAAGLITVWSEANAFVQINPGLGLRVYLQLHEHKTKGGNFADFVPHGV